MSVVIYQALSDHDIADCFKIRREVFIEGQGVPEEEERDSFDKISDHYILRTNGIASGTARIRYIANKAKIERVAILSEYQSRGLGKTLMEHLIKTIRDFDKVKIIALGSQMHAIPFYENLGFSVCGNEYIDASIRHKDMQLNLS